MKRWAILTVLLYVLFFLLLTVPALRFYGLDWTWSEKSSLRWTFSFADAADTMAAWGYWVWLAVVVGAEALLLLVPLQIAERRLTARRHLAVPVVTTAFLVANLTLAGTFSALCLALGDDAFDPFLAVAKGAWALISRLPFLSGVTQPLAASGNVELAEALAITGSIVVVLWMIWGLVFHRFAREDDAETLVRRVTRWLLRGSIAELLVAVPSHIVVRGRNDCCAPGGTFWGITTGLAVRFLAFGPAVLFLFIERCWRRRPRKLAAAAANGGE